VGKRPFLPSSAKVRACVRASVLVCLLLATARKKGKTPFVTYFPAHADHRLIPTVPQQATLQEEARVGFFHTHG